MVQGHTTVCGARIWVLLTPTPMIFPLALAALETLWLACIQSLWASTAHANQEPDTDQKAAFI
jgi:hypothetical protein